MKKRVFLIVLDSVGAGAAPDAASFGDAGTNTLRSCFETGELRLPNLRRLGLANIEGLSFLSPVPAPLACHMRMTEASAGKDTTVGHWEIAGHISERPLSTFPEGFPAAFLAELEAAFSAYRGTPVPHVLCNRPYSGTEVIRDFGEEHLRTGGLIVYTSADSVLQIAAHVDVVPTEELYEYCRIARRLADESPYRIGRVIARPFAGEAGSFFRTPDRRDFSLLPPPDLLCDRLSAAGLDCIAVGKISDIFCGRGFTESYPTHGNGEGMEKTAELLSRDFHGLAFINLVDFDMLYGHRNDAVGYAQALNAFDSFLGEMLPRLREDDALLITADHGCDPSDVSTDHTREYTPLLIYGKNIPPRNYGTRQSFNEVTTAVERLLLGR